MSQAVQVGDGARAAREADVAARGGLHPRPVPAHGAHSRQGRARPERRRSWAGPTATSRRRSSRSAARCSGQGRQPGHRGRAGPALRLRHPRSPSTSRIPSPIPVGFWRSVGASLNTFGVESMIDELAAAAGAGPVPVPARPADRPAMARGARRRRRARATGSPAPPAGRARGIAIGTAFNSIVAEVVEISGRDLDQPQGEPRLDRARLLPGGEPGLDRGAAGGRHGARPQRGALRPADLR